MPPEPAQHADDVRTCEGCESPLHADLCARLDEALEEIERLRAALYKIAEDADDGCQDCARNPGLCSTHNPGFVRTDGPEFAP